MTYLSGTVNRLRKFGKTFTLIEIIASDRKSFYKTLAYRGRTVQIKPGDYISCYATESHYLGKEEYLCSAISILPRRKGSAQKKQPPHMARSSAELEKLYARSIFEQALQDEAHHQNFLPVKSPTVVNRWPEGNTTPFNLDFYRNPSCLTISNMIYHQMMLHHGFNKIYEIGKLFRKENPSTHKRLAEFTIFGIAMSCPELDVVMKEMEHIIIGALNSLNKSGLRHIVFPAQPTFERITFTDLLMRSRVDNLTGSQLTKPVRDYLNDNYSSFVWVTNFPDETRPFYIHSINGTCNDCQLWYRGRIYIAAGGMVEPDKQAYEPRMRGRGQNPAHFRNYLHYPALGMPTMGQIDFGIERLLAAISDESFTAEFTWFPRYESAAIEP
ncbi:Asparagine--tRNA ligase [Serratia ficaria]|uniref:amino acid--tRNA ligase-related protein n=1 Tax=Serratia ficaria TaxID=61651 RepID=UPI001DE9EEBE|nr:amino acid--tRNA ligase-related protein [Serratia ficaria]NLU17485.1 hypothetical protein [Serratia liquefaciens]CAI2533222.1 Asparagine--tRNA ligase [Serratia ficaria]